ncbi:cell division protein ZapA [Candidatus Dependentiae bacterium]|nr:cell division protein ZapA [Candidatus Dependentiae bacterium]
MSVEIKKYKARIFGELYAIKSDEDEKNIAEVVGTVDNYMREISLKSSGALDAKQIAVLTALKLAQELLELQGQIYKDKQHLEKILALFENKEEPSLF